jgi:DNA primase
MPVAAPVGWEELKEIDRADAFTVADVELLLKRASTSESDQWGKCTQSLPHLG